MTSVQFDAETGAFDAPIGPVDLVYSWVDGSLPGYLEERQKYAKTPVDMNPERWRDIHESLRYSLRSAEIYAPWINRIFILTNRPQVPAWLDTSHPRIRVVHTDEFIPARYLPTFNSNVIESFVSEVPGLSEHFIYMCDDFFFYRPNDISDFYRDGKYTVFNTFFGENLRFRIYYQKHIYIGTGFIEHGPHFAKKEYWRAMCGLLPEQMEATRTHRFRENDDLVTFKLYRRYMLDHQRDKSRTINCLDFRKFFAFLSIKNDPREAQAKFDRVRSLEPKGLCINDDQRKSPNPEVVQMVREFLEESYPAPSAFEKPPTA